MTTIASSPTMFHEPELVGQTVIVIGGSSGIGLETARRARTEGADIIVSGRNPDRLRRAADELGALNAMSFDAYDSASLEAFFRTLPDPIDHIMVTAGGPYYATLREMDLEQALRDVQEHLQLTLQVARSSIGRVRPGGSLLFDSGTGARRPAVGLTIASMMTAALPALIANLALELAPVRVNLIAPGFVDTPPRQRCWATALKSVGSDSAKPYPSGGWSDPPMSPRWPCT